MLGVVTSGTGGFGVGFGTGFGVGAGAGTGAVVDAGFVTTTAGRAGTGVGDDREGSTRALRLGRGARPLAGAARVSTRAFATRATGVPSTRRGNDETDVGGSASAPGVAARTAAFGSDPTPGLADGFDDAPPPGIGASRMTARTAHPTSDPMRTMRARRSERARSSGEAGGSSRYVRTSMVSASVAPIDERSSGSSGEGTATVAGSCAGTPTMSAIRAATLARSASSLVPNGVRVLWSLSSMPVSSRIRPARNAHASCRLRDNAPRIVPITSHCTRVRSRTAYRH